MNPSAQIQRSLLLQHQGRHEMAEKELRELLAASPENGFALALLAISLAELKRCDEAEKAARESIGQEPDMAFGHYALARVLMERNRLEEASGAITEAVRLEPEDADYHGMRAAIEFNRERWTNALEAAETGLQKNAEHVTCNNLRAMALVKLGRKAEAGTTIDRTLAREPENSFSHANKGWALLEQDDRRKALDHFRESLRLEPGNDWARQGLVEALKAGNPLYAVMLKYFLWMQKLSPGARWGIIIGGYFASRMLGSVARSNPELAMWVLPFRVLYVSFALMTWLAAPIFNLFLFLHPLGRHALNQDQRRQALGVGTCLVFALILALPAINPELRSAHLMSAMMVGLLSIPVAAIFSCEEGWPRTVMTAIACVLGGLALTAVGVLTILRPEPKTDLAKIAGVCTAFFFLGTFITFWVANWLATKSPQR